MSEVAGNTERARQLYEQTRFHTAKSLLALLAPEREAGVALAAFLSASSAQEQVEAMQNYFGHFVPNRAWMQILDGLRRGHYTQRPTTEQQKRLESYRAQPQSKDIEQFFVHIQAHDAAILAFFEHLRFFGTVLQEQARRRIEAYIEPLDSLPVAKGALALLPHLAGGPEPSLELILRSLEHEALRTEALKALFAARRVSVLRLYAAFLPFFEQEKHCTAEGLQANPLALDCELMRRLLRKHGRPGQLLFIDFRVE